MATRSVIAHAAVDRTKAALLALVLVLAVVVGSLGLALRSSRAQTATVSREATELRTELTTTQATAFMLGLKYELARGVSEGVFGRTHARAAAALAARSSSDAGGDRVP